MASSKEYLNFILERLKLICEISYRPMMGEYLLYYNGTLFGGIYDDRFLIKKTEFCKTLKNAEYVVPYSGA